MEAIEPIKYQRFETREEWLEARKEGIGGSAAGTILGVNRFDTPWQYWMRLKGKLPPQPENVAMRMGHVLEPAVAQLFAEETGFEAEPLSEGDFIVRNADYPHLIGSPDRIGTKDGRDYVLECKTTAVSVTAGDIPRSWYCQLQFYMLLTGIGHGAVAWLSRGRDFGYEEIERNDDFCCFMASKLEAWWQTYVIGDRQPDPSPIDAPLAFPDSEAEAVELTAEQYTAVQRLAEIKSSFKALEAEEAQLSNYVKSAMGVAEVATFKGEKVATWKTSKPLQSFDSKGFKEAHPDLYAQYLKPGVASRPFLLKI